jgi:7,8-dihydropterin-6-yl-methyl-4-(beta-D-ribofuranosyl)aminobenzene 5'-phosphate synthase
MPRNAAALGIDIGRADAIVLSHGHYDHTGNLRLALERTGRAELLLHAEALRTRYSIHASP